MVTPRSRRCSVSKETPTVKSTGRGVVVLYSVKKNLIADAVAAVADYGKHQPQSPGTIATAWSS
jgi:hypothetical protein